MPGSNSLLYLRYFLTFLALAIALFGLHYFLVETSGFLSLKSTDLKESPSWYIPFYMHVGFGATALGTGIFQFYRKFRVKHLKTHKLLGKIYLLSVMLSGISAVIIAFHATGGIITQTGFFSLGVVWLFTGWMAYKMVIEGDIYRHEIWITRNYAITFGAVMLRIWLPLLDFGLGLSFVDAYRIVAWISWVPNLIVIEWYIRKYIIIRG